MLNKHILGVRMERMVTTDELRSNLDQVLDDLAEGTCFLIIDRHQPLAHLQAIGPRRPKPISLPHPVEPALTQCRQTFPDEILCRLSGLTLQGFQSLSADGRLPEVVARRLHCLAEMLEWQRRTCGIRAIQQWWNRSNVELGGVTPVNYLARPWNPGDDRSTQLLALVQRDQRRAVLNARPHDGDPDG